MHHYNSISPFMHCKCVQQARGHTRVFHSYIVTSRSQCFPRERWNVSLWHGNPLAVSAFVMTLSFVNFFFRIKKRKNSMRNKHAHMCPFVPSYMISILMTLHEEKRKQNSGLEQNRVTELIVYSVFCLPLYSSLFFSPSLFVSREKLGIDELQKCPRVFDEKW